MTHKCVDGTCWATFQKFSFNTYEILFVTRIEMIKLLDMVYILECWKNL